MKTVILRLNSEFEDLKSAPSSSMTNKFNQARFVPRTAASIAILN
mgnify:CR=1 FL=1